MNKNIQKAIIVIFFSIIFLFAACLVFNHDKVVSNSENRILATFPELNWKTIKSGSFMDDFETFVNDQITGRDWFVQLSTRTKILLGQKDINGVYITDDSLYSKVHKLTDDQLSKVDKSNLQLIKFLQNTPNAYFGIIPTAIEFSSVDYPNKLNQQNFIDTVYEQLPATQTIDFYSILDTPEEVYYRTDHHWTTLGAYYGYQAIGDTVGFDTQKKEAYQVSSLKSDFSGTTQSKLNIPLFKDTIYQWTLHEADEYTRVVNDIMEYDSLYDLEKLDSSEPYAVFLGGNNGKVVVRNNSISEARQGTKLLLIKDSYSHSLTPFLLEQYEEITLIDLRYAGMVSVQNLIKQENYDTILVLYNTENYISETKLLFLNK